MAQKIYSNEELQQIVNEADEKVQAALNEIAANHPGVYFPYQLYIDQEKPQRQAVKHAGNTRPLAEAAAPTSVAANGRKASK